MAAKSRRNAAEAKLTGREWEKCTAEDLRACLRRRHQEAENSMVWIYIEELRTATGVKEMTAIDAWAMNTMPYQNLQRIAYEIKVARSDFLKEIRTPAKRKVALMYSNLFYFVTPPGLIEASECPAECGLIEYGADGIPYTRVTAPWRDSLQPSWQFLASVEREIKRRARDRALEETAYFTAQKQASLQYHIDSQNEAQSRAAGAWVVVKEQEEDIHFRRKAIDQACQDAGLPVPNWYQIDIKLKQEHKERLERYGYGLR